MDREQKFWLCVWGMALVFFLSLIVSATVNSLDRRDKWDKAVSNGADPMVTTCALYQADTHGESAICAILAQNRK
jgi:Na+-transporting methylmalonyl-CoA/oxaloacetate decarboxylase gamma subunit